MTELVQATPQDAHIIALHRHRMFVDAGRADDAELHKMTVAFEQWVAEALELERYQGWFVKPEGVVVAGVGVLWLEWPPHPLDPEPVRGYLLNVYTAPEYRRQGLGRRLVQRVLDEAERRRVRVVALHATTAGRSLYEQLGFQVTNEMYRVQY